MNSPAATDFLARRAAHLSKKIRSKADDLLELAEQLDRHARDVERVGHGTPTRQTDSYAWVVHDVQHAVETTVANLVLHNLTTDAYELDSLRLSPDA